MSTIPKPVFLTTLRAHKWLRISLLLSLALNGLAGLHVGYLALFPPGSFYKDFAQEWVLAKALVMGLDPYLPLPELMERTAGPLPVENLPHPTPHPPPVAVFSLPLALLSYPQAIRAWFLIELGLLVVCALLVLTELNVKPGPIPAGVAALILLGWQPFVQDLAYGQLMIPILVLVFGAWVALRKEKWIVGGLLLGLAFSIKIMIWPVLLLLIGRKTWRASLAAAATIFLANLAAGIGMGFGRLFHYYTQVGSQVFALYRSFSGNYSTWTLGWRLFAGTGSDVLVGVQAPPWIAAPAAAPYVSAAVPLLILGLSLAAIWRMKNFDRAFASLVILSILISPVAWPHYFSLLIIPLIGIARGLARSAYPARPALVFAGAGAILVIPEIFLNGVMKLFALSAPTDGLNTPVPVAAAALSLLPIAAVASLLWLSLNLNHAQKQTQSPAGD
jgi:hypothetical protein